MNSSGLERRALLGGVAASVGWPCLARAQARVIGRPLGPPRPIGIFDVIWSVEVATGQRAALQAWAETLAPLAEGWWATIDRTLASPGFTPVGRITLNFIRIDPKTIPAATQGSTILVSAEGLLARIRDPDTFGMIAHEMVHVAQRYPHAPGWLTEGVADYLRYYVLLPDDPSRAFAPTGVDWKSGYQPTAALLDWVETKRPGTVTRLNRGLREGADGQALLAEAAGMPLNDAWAAYLASNPQAITPKAVRRRFVAQRLSGR